MCLSPVHKDPSATMRAKPAAAPVPAGTILRDNSELISRLSWLNRIKKTGIDPIAWFKTNAKSGTDGT